MGNCFNSVARFTEFLTLYEQMFIQSYHHHEHLIPEQHTYDVNPLYKKKNLATELTQLPINKNSRLITYDIKTLFLIYQ